MALKYVGNGQYVGGIPAQDLSDSELSEMIQRGVADALLGRSSVSLAEFEGALIQSGAYKNVSKDAPKAPKKDEE